MILEVCGINNTLLRVNNALPNEMSILLQMVTGQVDKFQRKPNWDGSVKFAWYIGQHWYLPANCWKRLMTLSEPDNAAMRPAYDITILGLENLTNPDLEPEVVETFVQSLMPPWPDVNDHIDVMYSVLKERYTTHHVATGFGKTYLCYLLSEWNRAVYDGITVIVVPRAGLVSQGFDDFTGYHTTQDEPLQVYGMAGGFRNLVPMDRANVVIGTYQSLSNMPDDWFLRVTTLLIDEAHMGKATSIIEIAKKCQKAQICTGISGTMQYLSSADALSVEAYIGPLTKVYPVHQQISKGRLPKVAVQPIQLNLSGSGEVYNAILQANGLKPTSHRSPETASAYRRAEISYITNNEKVLDYVLSLCQAYTSKGMNILVLFKNVQPVLSLFDYANDRGVKCHMIFGGTPRTVRSDIKKQIEREGGWILVATDGTMSMGESINRLHASVSITIGHSPHVTLQAIGRNLRNHESKLETTMLYDISVNLQGIRTNTTEYDMKDSRLRQAHYRNEQYPIEKTVCRDINV